MNRAQKGNIAGIIAILLWATLALFTVFTNRIPPFELTFIAFSIAFTLGLFLWIKEGKGIGIHLKLPWKVWLLGIYGLFGYHFFYFLALKSAPALEANLINYLWPLLIVLLSSFLPREKLKWFHFMGAFLGFLGVFMLLGFDKEIAFSSQHAQGYMYALFCALIWSSYSVLSRYFGAIPTLSVGGFCGASALLSLVAHLVFEQTYIPNTQELLAAIGLGLGPVGIAFFVWDYGMKQGDIKLIGSLSYATPLLSTLMLVFFGRSAPNSAIWIACFLIVLGSVVSSFSLLAGMWQKISTRNRPL